MQKSHAWCEIWPTPLHMRWIYRRRVTSKYLQRQFEVVLLCRDWLAERNNKSLREHMKVEGI
jgi:hypothetical protein